MIINRLFFFLKITISSLCRSLLVFEVELYLSQTMFTVKLNINLTTWWGKFPNFDRLLYWTIVFIHISVDIGNLS